MSKSAINKGKCTSRRCLGSRDTRAPIAIRSAHKEGRRRHMSHLLEDAGTYVPTSRPGSDADTMVRGSQVFRK